MQKIKLLVVLVISLFTLTGCEFLGDIFQAGLWIGIIAVVIVVAIIAWIIRRFRG